MSIYLQILELLQQHQKKGVTFMDERPAKQQNGNHQSQTQQQNRVRFQEPDKDDEDEEEVRQDDAESNQVRTDSPYTRGCFQHIADWC